MPYYEIVHTTPLSLHQKTQLAQHITDLHAKAFTTPSFFVNVKFTSVASDAENTYFIAGKPLIQGKQGENRILAIVRTSEKRKREHFDEVGRKIEEAWYQVVCPEEAKAGKKIGAENVDPAKKLLTVVFTPMLAVRENGFTIPTAGSEGEWVKENRTVFEERAKTDQSFADMLNEIEERDDLSAWR